MSPGSPKTDAFSYKLEILKWELDLINKNIERMDNFAQASKNWAVLIWVGVISLSLSKDIDNTRSIIVLFSALIPLLFWYIDSFFRRLQRRSIFRQNKISEYLNSEIFINDCNMNAMKGIHIVDPTGVKYRNEEVYQRFVSQKITMKFKEVSVFYSGLAIISIILSIILWAFT